MEFGNDDNFKFERLDGNSNLSNFFCGLQEMDHFIHNGYITHIKNNPNSSFCIKKENEIGGHFSVELRNLILEIDDVDKFNSLCDEKDKLVCTIEGAQVPSMEIDYLAVSKDWRGKGIGSIVINTIENYVKSKYSHVKFLSVNAYHTIGYSATGFYYKNNFVKGQMEDSLSTTLKMYKHLLEFEE